MVARSEGMANTIKRELFGMQKTYVADYQNFQTGGMQMKDIYCYEAKQRRAARSTIKEDQYANRQRAQ